MKKILDFITRKKTAIAKSYLYVSAYCIISDISVKTACAATPKSKDDAKNIVQTVLNIFVDVFAWFGGFYAAYGLYKLVMALRNDNDPNALGSAAKDIVIGALLVVFRIMFWDEISKLMF